MPHPVVNTKVDRAVEAIENLALAVAQSVAVGGGAMAYDQVKDARAECADALREFLAPTIRVVTDNGQRV